ncbi:uncharacterized protein B0H64DRAFT_355933 [Chaetomium fimeti]|uniref:Prolyl 4-hydroxylase alpha subunit Fe(2+) 2OG dioxygenase domain-containing protein n=1 Tax=Chaetomium fimeti TaxID=1854472 RepID=A0AAE0LW17_9PEZI|nr:hypothetical protein B0H64DRAFT_355933 [Chaetomium fimeti]
MDVRDLLVRPAPNAVANGKPNRPVLDGAWETALEAKLDGILRDLDDIKHQGSFAGFGALQRTDFADQLGLYVDGVGSIGVPLQEEQARQLISQCRQAPFGKGSETIVDTSVRNTWELDASQFRFYSDSWARTMEKCIGFVKSELGITSPIIADPYKMLIYEKGALFKAHTDTEKIPGMFGTLVICLPSHHTGGAIVLRHAGQKTTYKTSAAQPSVLCWYSDVHHEVLPVESGYRWVLTYNLAMSPDLERPSAALLQPQVGKLQQSLASWIEHLAPHNWEDATGKDIPHFYYLLEHEYTEASIALRALKTTDLSRVQCLRDISTKLDFDVFLAVLEKSEQGGVEHAWKTKKKKYWGEDSDESDDDGLSWHELDDVYETSLCIKKLVDLDGALLRSEMKIDEDDLEENLIPAGDPFEGVNSRNEEYEGFTGNSGPTATHFYRTTVVVVVPRSSTDRFLTQNLNSQSAQVMLRQYAEKHLVPGAEPTRRQSVAETMRQLAKQTWKPNPSAYDKPDRTTVLEVLRAAVVCCEYDLFNDVLGLVHTTAVSPAIFGLVKTRALAGQIALSKIKKSILDSILVGDLEHRGNCSQFLRPPGEERNEDLEALTAELASQSIKALEVVFNNRLLQESDGLGIMSMVDYPQGYDLFKTRVLPVLEASTPTNTTFVLGALPTLTSWVSKEGFPQAESLAILKRISESVIASLDISKLRTQAALVAEQPRPYYSSTPATLTPAQRTLTLDPSKLAAFTNTILTHSWHDLLTLLSQKITAQAPSIPRAEYQPFWLPFLRKLLHDPATAIGTPSPHQYKTLTATLLTSYLTRSVGDRPPANPSLALPPTRCSCGDCAPLNAFLASPHQRVGRFALGEKRRRHMGYKLDACEAARSVRREEERGGACGALVVTKVGTMAEREKAAWEERVGIAMGWMRVLGEGGVLGMVLGGDGEGVGEVLGVFLRQSGVEMAGGGRGVKRKAEEEVVVID